VGSARCLCSRYHRHGVPPGGGARWEDQALARIIDLHTHTTIGSFDSRTTPADLSTVRDRIPALEGVVLTEHVHRWPPATLAELPDHLAVFNEREFDTYQGHILVLGASGVTRASNVQSLREDVVAAGGLLILAHPFRFYPSPLSLLYPRDWHEPGEWPAERLAEHLLFDLVDAVEGWNYRATRVQNTLAEACARIRRLPIVAGSDSHAPADVGRFATEFDSDIHTLEQLIAAIREGCCRPVELASDGFYRPLSGAGDAADR
jgi:predicted metal-dependent phosphoesterase TrpH